MGNLFCKSCVGIVDPFAIRKAAIANRPEIFQKIKLRKEAPDFKADCYFE